MESSDGKKEGNSYRPIPLEESSTGGTKLHASPRRKFKATHGRNFHPKLLPEVAPMKGESPALKRRLTTAERIDASRELKDSSERLKGIGEGYLNDPSERTERKELKLRIAELKTMLRVER